MQLETHIHQLYHLPDVVVAWAWFAQIVPLIILGHLGERLKICEKCKGRSWEVSRTYGMNTHVLSLSEK